MSKSFIRCLLPILAAALLTTGCSSYQPTKNAWKGTKGMWNDYIAPSAKVDYSEKGDLSPRALALTHSMMGIDVELSRLERTMLNADKPPTRGWIADFFAAFPWVSGFAGVKYDGTILGQEPANGMKQLDFIPLLYEDKKQNSRALRCDVQNTPLGPEVLIGAPLYDGTDFLGIVAAYFEMRALTQYSSTPDDVVILTPGALLWAGKYEYAATPLSGVNWAETVVKSASGTCSNATGSFYYIVRWLGNLPLVFAVAESGTFPQGTGDLEQGLAFFPKEREKLPPPPQPERKTKIDMSGGQSFGAPEGSAAATAGSMGSPTSPASASSKDIQPGSSDSVLLKKGQQAKRRQVEERRLEGQDNAPTRVRQPQRMPIPMPMPEPEPLPQNGMEVERPSPFGPAKAEPEAQRPSPFGPAKTEPEAQRPSPFGPNDAKTEGAAAPATSETSAVTKPAEAKPAEAKPAASETPAATKPAEAKPTEPEAPAVLPGGRPSPFGPGN